MASIIGPAVALSMAESVLRPKGGGGISDEKWQEIQDKAQSDQEALDKVTQARKQARTDRKANARKKLEELKKRIQLLKQMGINSKATARELARLARELKGAARDFRTTGQASDIAISTSTPESQAAEKDAESKSDQEFANEVRKIAQLLKAMLKRAKKEQQDEEDKRGLEQAGKDVQTAMEDSSAIIAQATGAPFIGEGGLLV